MIAEQIGGERPGAFIGDDGDVDAGHGVEQLRGLAVADKVRSPALPDVPTSAESGLPGYEAVQYYGLAAPAGTPKPIVDELNRAINEALADPAVFSALEKAGIDPTPGSTPETTAAFVKAELAKWAPIIKAARRLIDGVNDP